MSLTARFLVAFAFFLIAAASVDAAEIKRSVPEILSDQPDEYSRMFSALTRCSGFYMATSVLMDRQVQEFGKTELADAAERSMRASFILSQMLTELMKERGGTETDAAKNIQVVAEAYLRRMDNNYAVNGTYMADDSLMNTDMEVCKGLVEN